MKKPAFHIFKILDCYFMFDVKNCIFYKINKIFFDFLSIWYSEVNYTIDDAIRLIREAPYSPNSIALFTAAIDDLTKNNVLCKYLECTPLSELRQFELDQWNEYTDLISIELMLTEACNMSCKYCFCGKRNETLMSKQTAQKAINFLINMSGKRKNIDILFFGGEPLLNKPVFNFALEYASSVAKRTNKKVNFRITTNGTLIDNDIAALIYKFKVKTMISLDGPPQVHNSQCPMADGSNSYDKILNGLSVLQKHDNPYVIRCTMTHHPPPLLTLLNSLEKLVPKEIIVEPVLSPNYCHYDLTFDQGDYRKLIKQNEILLPKLIQDFKNGKCVYNPYRRFLQAINTSKHNDASIFHCGACRYSLNIGADGSLYPCCRFSGMHDWKIGNLYDKLDIKKSKRFWQFYEDVRNSRCSSCWAESICGGQCPWEWADKNGTFCSNDTHCFRRKAYIEQAAYFYWQIKDNKPKNTPKKQGVDNL